MAFGTRDGGDLGEVIRRIPAGGWIRGRLARIALAFVILLLLFWSVTSIPTGHVGVLTLFGRVTGQVLPEGIHLINPLKAVQRLSIQTQSRKESASVPSNEGLILSLDTSLLFRLDRNKTAQVYQLESVISLAGEGNERPKYRSTLWEIHLI